MSYSSQVTSVLPIQTGLTSTSLPLTFTLPAGSLTSSNLAVDFGIVSVTVSGFACANAPAEKPRDATTAVRRDTFKRFTMVPTRVLSTTVMNLPVRGKIVVLLGVPVALAAGCQRGQPEARHDVTSTRPVATAPAAR